MARVNSWDGKFLSRAGKEILLKTVIQSLPTYAMSVFLIPLGICEDIEKLMASFWWKTSASKGRGIIWMSWDRMAKPKLEGGRIFKAKYFPTSDYLSADLGNNPSFVWRSIWAAQSVVRYGAVRIIGNGETTSILSSPWLPDNEHRLVTSTHPALLNNTVSSLFSPEARIWDYEQYLRLLFTLSSPVLLLWHVGIPLVSLMIRFILYLLVVGLRKYLWLLMMRKLHGRYLCSIWAIWKARNLVVWKSKTSSRSEVIASAQITLDHWRNAQDNTTLSSLFFENEGDGAERWTKPEANKIKINVDAALFPQDNSYGFGIVARDSSGSLIEAQTRYFGGVYDAEVVEAMGVKEALSWIKSKNWSDVEIETDSMLTVQGIRSNYTLNSIFGLIIHDCQLLFSSLNNVRICFIRRSANRVAHVVARHSRFLSGRSIFEHNAWDELSSLMYSEC
ncbi:uncharacterized protein LOC133032219 [Cannabis sativa]|uniref:uncharacterized protein LOC133032219 n=1 Tax=Cannabis sativa TaxID=3483 RepID=UPI0029CA7344|nr:uncharacterized protein LOC133032219 [Cannabis sativa]